MRYPYKVLVLNQTGKKWNFKKDVSYWNDFCPKKFGVGLEVDYTFKDISPLPLSHIKKTKNGIERWSLDPIPTINLIKPFVPEGEFDEVILIYNEKDTALGLIAKGDKSIDIRSTCPSQKVWPDTAFVEIAVGKNGSNTYKTKTVNHERFHALERRLNHRGVNVTDVMDRTLVKGKWEDYYKNDEMYALDGNRAETIKIFKPYWLKLKRADKPVITNTKPMPVMKETDTYTRLKVKAQDNFPTWIIVHHTGGTDANPLADTSHHTAKDVEKWHLAKGWEGIGYTYYIEKNGDIWKGRPEHYHGGHTVSHNKKSIGICLAGNFDATLPTPQQVESLKLLMQDIMARHKIPKENIVPHRTFAVKTCYGNKLDNSWARNLVV